MAISDAMLARGQAVGVTPLEGESSQKFGARVRKAEAKAKPAAARDSAGRGR